MAALLTLNLSMDKAVDAYLDKTLGTYDLMVGYRKADTRLSYADLQEISGRPGVTDVAGILIPYMNESHRELRHDLFYYGAPDSPLGRQFMPLETGSFPRTGEVALSAPYAKREGYQVGETVRLAFPPYGEREVRISGLVAMHKRVSIGIALFERGSLEEATGRPGATFALVNTAKETDHQRLVGELQQRFPELDYDLRKFRNDLSKNMDALRPVALGMGITTLLASVFLLTASFRMSLSERTRELALLRAVGATPRQVRRLILAEGVILGCAGSLAGAIVGVTGAILAAGGFAQLLSVEPVPAAVPWGQVVGTVGAGILLAILSALGVARTADRSEPLRAMRPDLPAEEQEVRRGGRFGLFLVTVGAVAVSVTPLMPKEPIDGVLRPLAGSTGALAVALGLLLGVQRLLPLMLSILALPFRRRPEGPIAVRGLLRHRRRSGLTVGALGLGLILVLSIGTMSTSLIGRWYEQARKEHPADIQLEVPFVYHRGVSAELAQKVTTIPGVTMVGTVGEQAQTILVDYDWSRASPEYVKAMDDFEKRFPNRYVRQRDVVWVSPADLPSLMMIGSYRVVAGSVQGWGGGSLAMSKGYAEQLGIQVGDRLKVNIKQGSVNEAVAAPDVRELTVTAIVESDSWRMPRALIAEPLPGASDRLRMVYANVTPERREAARQQVRELTHAMEYNIVEYSDAETATAELQTWTNQRFALLLAVGVIMAAVAVMSLVNTMMNNVNERQREFALLRSVGATPAQVRNVVVLEAGLLGLVGGLVGATGGTILGAGALYGLDLPLSGIRLPWGVIAGGLAVSLVLAMVAAVSPACRVMRAPPAEAVGME